MIEILKKKHERDDLKSVSKPDIKDPEPEEVIEEDHFLKQKKAHKEEIKVGHVKEEEPVPDSINKEMKKDEEGGFHLKGFLYKKLFKPIEQIKIIGRAGQLLRSQSSVPQDFPKFTTYRSKRLTNLLPKNTLKVKGMIYPLIQPYSYANIKMEDSDVVYNVIEPKMTSKEQKIFDKLKEGMMQVIDVSMHDIKKEEKMIDYLEKNVRDLITEYDFSLNEKEYLKILYYIFRDFVGLNEIEPLLNDPYIEDLGCDGVGVPIYAVHQRYGSLRTNVVFEDEELLKDFVTKLAERCDRYISYAEPLLDGTLPSGSRVQASLASDVTTRGPTFSIRKFRESPFTPVEMIGLNTVSSDMLAYLWYTIESGINVLIAGGVATGKTSILNTLSLFIKQEAKIVSIEDTRELSLPHENWIPGAVRVGFSGTKTGEVTMFDLLRESFRQNPDYLIVGEVRGKEAYIMFQAMSSGHPSISTIHAGSMEDVMKRLTTEPINLSPGLLESLDMVIIMIHARDRGKSARRVKEIVELQSIDSVTGRPRVTKSFIWIPSKDVYEYRGNSWVLHKISIEKGIPMNKIFGEIAKRKAVIEYMVDKNIKNMKEASKIIQTYQNAPEKLEKIIGEYSEDTKNREDENGDTGI
jgi:archaeal flagellar protein FlaI